MTELFNSEDLTKFGAGGDIYSALAGVDSATVAGSRRDAHKYFAPLFKANKLWNADTLREAQGIDDNADAARNDMIRAGLGGAADSLGGNYGVNPYATARNLGLSGLQYSQQIEDRGRQHLQQQLQNPLNQMTQIGYTGSDAGSMMLNAESMANNYAMGLHNVAAGQQATVMQGEVAAANNEAAEKNGQMAAGAAILGALIMAMCWVAREVFEEERTEDGRLKWVVFRKWLLSEAPMWFRLWYMENGQEAALWLHDRPRCKKVAKWAMSRVVRESSSKTKMSFCGQAA